MLIVIRVQIGTRATHEKIVDVLIYSNTHTYIMQQAARHIQASLKFTVINLRH